MVIYNINNINGGNYESFVEKCPELFKGIVHNNAQHINELNFLDVDDQLRNQDLLDDLQKANLREMIMGNWYSNWVMGGLKSGLDKDVTLAEHLSLLNMVNIGKITGGAGHSIVRGCIRNQNERYTKCKSGRRLFDARASKDANSKHLKKFKFDKMNLGRRVIQVIFNYPTEGGLLTVDEHVTPAKDLMEQFYDSVHQLMIRMEKDNANPVQAFIMSNEISCYSIRKSQFKPHVHVIIWINDYDNFDFLHDEQMKQMDAFNAGKPSALINWNIRDEYTDLEAVRNAICYIVKSTSLVQVYKREYQEADREEFNKKTVEAHHKLNQLWSGEYGRSMKRKFRYRVAKINK